VFQADKEVMEALIGGTVKVLCTGIKALVQAKLAPNKYLLPK